MELSKVTRELIERVKMETGNPIVFEVDDSIIAKAVWEYKGDRHVVKYQARWEMFVDHILAHEAGHILRVWGDHASRIRLPILSEETRKTALRDLRRDADDTTLQVLKDERWATILYSLAVQQLTNIPVDIRIEEWIRKEYPRLAPVQYEALSNDAKERYVVLNSREEKRIPQRLRYIDQVLTSAWLEFLRSFLDGHEFNIPSHNNKDYGHQGKKLFHHLQGRPDRGALGDRLEVDYWAEQLKMDGWYMWGDLPK